MKSLLLALPTMAVALPLYAQAPAPADREFASPGLDAASFDRWSFAGYWDNDGGPLKRNNIEDRHYTNGFAFVLAHHPDWADRLNAWLPFTDRFDRTAVGYLAGQLMFTPENISATHLIENDRPYAGYLFGGAFFQRANDTTLDHLQVELGVVGPSSLAEDLQDVIHEWTDGVDPRGWDHQLRDEPTLQTYYRRKWRFTLAGETDPAAPPDGRLLPQVQVVPQVGVALGTVHRHIEAGATLRVGGNLPDDFGPGRVADVAAFTAPRQPQGWFGYGFARVLGRAVEHNLFLEGNTWKDSHGVDEEPLVAEASLGVAVGYRSHRWSGELTYAQTAVTEEFKDQEGSNAYGSLAVTLTGWF